MSEALRPDLLTRLAALGPPAPCSAHPRAAEARGSATVFSGGPGAPAGEGLRSPGFLPDDAPASGGKFDERAAILEHDGGWTREEAEALAARLVSMEARGEAPATWSAFDLATLAMERSRAADHRLRGPPPSPSAQ